MANVSWDDLTPIADDTPKKQVSWDDLTPIEQPVGSLQSFAGGLINPLIHLVNLIPEAGRAIDEAVGDPLGAWKPPDIPDIPTSPGVAHGAGEFISYLPIFGGAESATARGIEKVAASLPRLLKSLGASTVAGGLTGAGTAKTGERESGAVGGAMGGALGNLIGQGASSGIRKATQNKQMQDYFKNTIQSLMGNKDDSATQASQDLLNSIIKKYSEARQNVRPFYNQTFQPLKYRGDFMQPSDLKSYTAELGGDTPAYIAAKFLKPNKLMTQDLQAIDPEDVHFYKSNLGKLANKYQYSNPVLANKYANTAEALSYDLNNFLNKKGALPNYQEAQSEWQKQVLPYVEDKDVQKILQNVDQDKISQFEKAKNIDEAKKSDVDNDVINTETPNFLKNSAPVTNLTRKFLPTHSEYDAGKMNRLTELLGDKDLATAHLKNIMYAMNKKSDGFDINNLLKTVFSKVGQTGKSLSPEQFDYLFSPEEKDMWQKIDRINEESKRREEAKKTVSPLKKTISALGGGMIGSAALPLIGGIGGAVAGYSGEPVIERAVQKALSSRIARKANELPLSLATLSAAPSSAIGARIGSD